MFTGIIQQVVKISQINFSASQARLTIKCHKALPKIVLGESIAIDGCCLTVVEEKKKSRELVFDISSETLSKTKIGDYKVGQSVNLERALKWGDALGGHFVSGHVDNLATVKKIVPQKKYSLITIQLPPKLYPYLIEKGSVALDGISLTVCDLKKSSFNIAIVPHTLQNTAMFQWKAGSRVHIETDILAKYLAKEKLSR